MDDRHDEIRFGLPHIPPFSPAARRRVVRRALLEQQTPGRVVLEQEVAVTCLKPHAPTAVLKPELRGFEQEEPAPVFEEQETAISHTYLPFGFEVADLIRP